MDIFFVTTFNSRLYKEYAHNFIETYINTNQEIPVICYVDDDYNYPTHKNITYIKLHEAIPQILDFKERHKDIILDLEYESYSDQQFLQNAVRFSHKVFAQVHASYSNKKFMYIDGDNIFRNKITKEFVNNFIPDDVFVTCYGRPNYVETGIIGFNSSLGNTSKIFFEKYLAYYTEDKIFDSKFKTDSQALDGTREAMKKISDYKEIDKGDGMDGHVIYRDKHMLNYLDHRKGKRKYEKIKNLNLNLNDSKIEKFSLISKIRVQLKNYIFKLFN
jgi:hypothetical protein